MKKNVLYKLKSDLGNKKFIVNLNFESVILQSHFSHDSILPGACNLLILSDCLSSIFLKRIFISEIENIKFFKPIRKAENSFLVDLSIEKLNTDYFKCYSKFYKGSEILSAHIFFFKIYN